MNTMILDFLEAYKSLDELCKQICSSERGISEYIDIMEREQEGNRKISGWESDYKRLKNLRWIRNRLVHESDSFQDNVLTTEDVEWLINFRARIMERSDPFALLHQMRNNRSNITKHRKNDSSEPSQVNAIHYKESNNVQNYHEPQKKDTNWKVGVIMGIAIFAGIIIGLLGLIALAGIIFFILLK